MHLARPVAEKDVQHLGRADAVEDVDPDPSRPAPADLLRQRLSGRNATAQCEFVARGQIVAGEHRIVEGRNPVKDCRSALAQHAADCRRRRPLRHQHAGGADRQWKGQRIAEPIGEEQLCRREHNIALVDAEHRDGIELGSLHQARMDVHGTLRPACRPR